MTDLTCGALAPHSNSRSAHKPLLRRIYEGMLAARRQQAERMVAEYFRDHPESRPGIML